MWRRVRRSVCGLLALALVAALLPVAARTQEGAGEKVRGGLESAGEATKSGLERAGEATGKAIGTVIEKTGQGIGTAIDKTGQGLKTAGEALTGRPAPTAAPLDGELRESDLPPEEPLVEPPPEYEPAPLPTADPWERELDPAVE
jgi:hypothetical protein